MLSNAFWRSPLVSRVSVVGCQPLLHFVPPVKVRLHTVSLRWAYLMFHAAVKGEAGVLRYNVSWYSLGEQQRQGKYNRVTRNWHFDLSLASSFPEFLITVDRTVQEHLRTPETRPLHYKIFYRLAKQAGIFKNPLPAEDQKAYERMLITLQRDKPGQSFIEITVAETAPEDGPSSSVPVTAGLIPRVNRPKRAREEATDGVGAEDSRPRRKRTLTDAVDELILVVQNLGDRVAQLEARGLHAK